VIETAETAAVDVSFLHTSHCLASGQVMISSIGDKDGKPKGKIIFIRRLENVSVRSRPTVMLCKLTLEQN